MPGKCPSRFVGVAALLFAASPSLSLALIVGYEVLTGQRRGGGGVAVGFAVPPLWAVWLFFLMCSVPWILVGILVLRRSAWGRWMGLVLTAPTLIAAWVCAAEAAHGIGGSGGELTPIGLTDGLFFGPPALFGALFCLASWTDVVWYCRHRAHKS